MIPMRPDLAVGRAGPACWTMTRRRWWSPTWTGTRFAPVFTAARPSPLLSDLPDATRHSDGRPQDAGAANGPGQQLAATPRSRTRTAPRRTGAASLPPSCSAMRMGPQVTTERPFKELGFDSLTAVELRNLLQTSHRHRHCHPASLFDYPTASRAGSLHIDTVRTGLSHLDRKT